MASQDKFQTDLSYSLEVSHECHGISNHWQLHCLFTHLFRRTSKKTSKLSITGPLCGESTSDQWIPHTKEPVTWKKTSISIHLHDNALSLPSQSACKILSWFLLAPINPIVLSWGGHYKHLCSITGISFNSLHNNWTSFDIKSWLTGLGITTVE